MPATRRPLLARPRMAAHAVVVLPAFIVVPTTVIIGTIADGSPAISGSAWSRRFTGSPAAFATRPTGASVVARRLEKWRDSTAPATPPDAASSQFASDGGTTASHWWVA